MARLDAAKFLGITPQQVDNIANAGELPYQQTASGKIFFESDVAALKKTRALLAKTDKRVGNKKLKAKD